MARLAEREAVAEDVFRAQGASGPHHHQVTDLLGAHVGLGQQPGDTRVERECAGARGEGGRPYVVVHRRRRGGGGLIEQVAARREGGGEQGAAPGQQGLAEGKRAHTSPGAACGHLPVLRHPRPRCHCFARSAVVVDTGSVRREASEVVVMRALATSIIRYEAASACPESSGNVTGERRAGRNAARWLFAIARRTNDEPNMLCPARAARVSRNRWDRDASSGAQPPLISRVFTREMSRPDANHRAGDTPSMATPRGAGVAQGEAERPLHRAHPQEVYHDVYGSRGGGLAPHW